jgi:purine-nucleoside phosphorylase
MTGDVEQDAPCGLDAAVEIARAAVEREGIPSTRALFLLGTGGGLLPLRLKHGARASWSKLAGIPDAWRGATLHAGELAGSPVWILEDAPGPPELGGLPDPAEPPWVRGFPCWLAAAAGASILVHTNAGASLAEEIEPGTLTLVSDHLNLSGRTPLLGLAATALGPLFPDTSRLHHAELRARALEISRGIGLPVREVVAACALGPALETAAERRFFARAGAQVAVQGLEGPLLAAAHAGLATLAVVCVTDRGDEGPDLASIVANAERMAPGLEELLARLAPDIASAAAGLEVEA